jgi:hypothetical protein
VQVHRQDIAGNVGNDATDAGVNVRWGAASAEEPSSSRADGADTPAISGVYKPVHEVLKSAESMGIIASCETAASCMSRFVELADARGTLAVLTEQDCLAIIGEAFERGNNTLAQVIFRISLDTTANMCA